MDKPEEIKDQQQEELAVQSLYLHVDYPVSQDERGLLPNIYSLKITIFSPEIKRDVWSYFKLPEKIEPKVIYKRTFNDEYQIQFNGMQLVNTQEYPQGLQYVLYEIHISDDKEMLPTLTQCDLTINELKKVGLAQPHSIHYKFYHYVSFNSSDPGSLPKRISLSESQLFGDDLIYLDKIYISVRTIVELPEFPDLFDQFHIQSYPQVEKFVYTRQIEQSIQEFFDFHNELMTLEVIGVITLLSLASYLARKWFRSK